MAISLVSTQALSRFRAALAAALLSLLAAVATGTAHAAMCSMDIDADGKTLPATDGLLMTRYLMGIRGSALVAGALGVGAARTAPADVEAFLATPCAQAGWVGQGSGRLNDTGISWGGEATTGNNATCAGATVAMQDCSLGRDADSALNTDADGAAGFSFTKISNSGDALPATAILGAGPNDWGCMYDNVTGLMWEIKTASGRRSSAHTYTWFSSDNSNNTNGTGTANGGTCDDVGQCDTEKYVQQTNLTPMCGHADWRLPKIEELVGIVHHGRTSPAIDPDWFPNTPDANFWSGTPSASGPSLARLVVFTSGFSQAANRSFPFRVRLVRAGH